MSGITLQSMCQSYKQNIEYNMYTHPYKMYIYIYIVLYTPTYWDVRD